MRWRQKTGERAGPPAGPDLPGPGRAPDEPRAGVSAVAAGWLAGATQAGPQAGGRVASAPTGADGAEPGMELRLRVRPLRQQPAVEVPDGDR